MISLILRKRMLIFLIMHAGKQKTLHYFCLFYVFTWENIVTQKFEIGILSNDLPTIICCSSNNLSVKLNNSSVIRTVNLVAQ